MPGVDLLGPTELLRDPCDAKRQFVLFGAGQRGLVVVSRDEHLPDQLARRASVVVASAEQDRRLSEVRDPYSVGNLLEVQDSCDAPAIVENVG